MSEHTPGPWHAAERGDGVDSEALREDDGQPALAVLIEVGRPADAHLIAAAPELLAVAHVARELVSIAFHCHQDEVQINGEWVSMSDVRALVYAAIAKAEGRGE